MFDSPASSTIMTLLGMPDEVLCHLLTYAEDTDLQTLALTCKRLRSLTLDGPLRRHILLIRTPARLQSSLSFRPSRDMLAKQNILRGVHIHHHIRQGHYIGGDSSVRSYQVSCRLERQMLSLRISRKLKSRPDWTELVNRGLIPEEMFVQPEDSEVKEKWRVYQLQRQRTHHPLLQQAQEQYPHSQLHHHGHHQRLQQQQQQQQQQQRDVMQESLSLSSSVPSQDGLHPLQHSQDTAMDVELEQHLPLIGASSKNASSSSEQKSAFTPPLPGTQGNNRTPQNNLHPTNSTLSPSSRPRRQRKSISMVLVPKIELLRRAMDRDRLSRLVQKRPSPTELNQSPKTATVLHAYHLVAFATTSPDLVPLTAQLSFLLKGERLSHWLFNGRPSLAVMLNERHILRTEVRTAWMVCPGVTQKVRFYEGLIQDRRLHEQQMQAQWLQQHQQPHQHQIHVE